MAIQILAGACIVHNNKILLVQQKPEGDQPEKWGPPAGHAESEETPVNTAIRETKEETNLDIEILGFVQSGILESPNAKDYVLVFYSAMPKNVSQLKIKEDEINNYVWATLTDLKENKFPLRKDFLKFPLIKSLTEKPLPLDSFEVYSFDDK